MITTLTVKGAFCTSKVNCVGCGTESETVATLQCTGQYTCSTPPKYVCQCQSYPGYLVPADNSVNCSGGGGGDGGGSGGCCTCDNGEYHAGCCTDVKRRAKASAAPTSGKPWRPTTRPGAADAEALISAADHRLSGTTNTQEPTTTTGRLRRRRSLRVRTRLQRPQLVA
jgi:hypothetical protein